MCTHALSLTFRITWSVVGRVHKKKKATHANRDDTFVKEDKVVDRESQAKKFIGKISDYLIAFTLYKNNYVSIFDKKIL